jgi:hypothetical protein
MTAHGRPMVFARSHPVVAAVVALVAIVLLVEVVGLAIYSFLLPLTG